MLVKEKKNKLCAYVCVCVCKCAEKKREKRGGGDKNQEEFS